MQLEPISRRPLLDPDPRALRMRWMRLAYVHWAVDPAAVQRHLPEGLTVDTIDGKAYVGLIPFDMRDVRLPGMPPVLPWVGDFPETNVRTYAVAPNGDRGVWFHSLEASRLGAMLVARGLFRLPYMWASMSITTSPGRIRYRTRRRWPGPRGAHSDLALRVGRRLADDEVTPLDDWLAARWRFLDGRGDGSVISSPMRHEVWPLHEATIEHLDDELVAAAGYPGLVDEEPAHVRFSPGVDVTGGFPRRIPGDPTR